ncbi:MAG: flagellar biosynthetic protein FliO [Ignavibacteria bacterium]|nr:MAG: flagellar biosynthetic protein FliO [Ignavibacteria bacterium]KAF0160130.1 MAG: flagellar biosynthetic protein FliO [Ignavibacteria bacterium]
MTFYDIIKSIIPLLAVLGMLYGVLVLVRKYSFSLSGKKIKNLHIDVVHNQLILPKKYLSLVRVKDKLLVLGISENNITVLKELDYAEFADTTENDSAVKGNFVEILKQNLGMK